MNTNDLVYKIAERAKYLGNASMLLLRTTAGSGDTASQSNRELKHLSRGELIEMILTEEFTEEYPKEIEDSEDNEEIEDINPENPNYVGHARAIELGALCLCDGIMNIHCPYHGR
jgi:hypothetical protein